MSVSHPLLKTLKVHVGQLCELRRAVRDSDPLLQPLCHNLQDIFNNALRGGEPQRLGIVSATPWSWLSTLLKANRTPQLSGTLYMALEHCQQSKKTVTDIGRFRLFLRIALSKKCLSQVVLHFRKYPWLISEYYHEGSLLGDDIYAELLMSLINIIEQKIQFSLNLRNASFLDDTWEIPWFRSYELVPSVKIGVQLQVVEGRLVVADVRPDSVADEDMKIEPGDVLDELWGEPLRNAPLRRVIGLQMEYRQCPIYIAVVKALHFDDTYFQALRHYHHAAGVQRDVIVAARKQKRLEIVALGGHDPFSATPEPEDVAINKQYNAGAEQASSEAGFYADYCGCTFVGQMGTVREIEHGVAEVLAKKQPKRRVRLDLTETDVVVMPAEDDTQILLRHSFPEISSCGRRIDMPKHFAFIAGESTCNLSHQFYCFVFEASSAENSKLMLNSIAKGFERTHWAV